MCGGVQVDDAAASPVAHLRDALQQQSLLTEECQLLRNLHPTAAELFAMDLECLPARPHRSEGLHDA